VWALSENTIESKSASVDESLFNTRKHARKIVRLIHRNKRRCAFLRFVVVTLSLSTELFLALALRGGREAHLDAFAGTHAYQECAVLLYMEMWQACES
jgi:hypothetical protein